ncbi:MAG: hypothetical protein KDA16_11480 [Phycisphaerales bacterium]|nr:hypothetical protein [Phycisphaerales bacterium]
MQIKAKKCPRIGYVAGWCSFCLEPRVFEMRSNNLKQHVPHDFLICRSCRLMGWTSRHEWLAISRDMRAAWSELAEISSPELLENANDLRVSREWIATRPPDDHHRRQYLQGIEQSAGMAIEVEAYLDHSSWRLNVIHAMLLLGVLGTIVWSASASQAKDANESLIAGWTWVIGIGLVCLMWLATVLDRKRRARAVLTRRVRPALQNAFRVLRARDNEIESLLEQASITRSPMGGRFSVADLSVGITERPVASLDSEEEDLLWSADSAD